MNRYKAIALFYHGFFVEQLFIFRIVSFAIILFCINSCAFVSEYRQSFPYGDNIEGKLHHEKIIFSDLEVHAKADNAIRLWEYATVTMVPVSLDKKDKPGNYPFRIRVGFLPKTKGFTFNPKEVYLSVNDHSEIQPTKYLFLPHLEKSKTMAKKWAAEGIVDCGAWHVSYEFKNMKDSTLSLNDINLWNCVELAFDISPPDPTQKIRIEIRGIRKNGQLYKIPNINFKEVRYRSYDSAP